MQLAHRYSYVRPGQSLRSVVRRSEVRGRSHHPPRGHQKTRAKAWYERGEGVTRLAHDRALVEREYPALAYRFDDEAGTACLEGTLVYRAACGIPTDVPVRIDFPFDYPRREPRALDVGGLFEHSLNRHFATDDGVCCLWLPPKSRWDPLQIRTPCLRFWTKW